MIAALIRWSVANRFLVLVATILVTAWGVVSLMRTPLDAIPDLSDTQVIIRTPFAGQAPRIVEDIMAVIEEIREEGIAILIVEQNSSLALSIAHRAYVIEDGRIVHESAATALEADADLKHRLLAV